MTSALFHLFETAAKPVAPYSHAVEADGWVFLTGQIPNHPADRRPARTCIGVTGLARGALVEIDIIVRRP